MKNLVSKVSVRRDAIVLPQTKLKRRTLANSVGVFDATGFVREALVVSSGNIRTGIQQYQEPIRHRDEGGIYAGAFYPSYGHFLTESLSRLWFAHERPDLPLIWDRGARVKPFHREILRLLGIKNHSIWIEEPTRIKELFIPYPGLSIGTHFDIGHRRFLGVVEPRKVIKGKKIYLSRLDFDGEEGKIVNERRLHWMLCAAGFRIVYPEKLSVEKQLNELTSSEVVLGLEGSALHTLLLCKSSPSTRFVILGRHRFGGGIFQHTKEKYGLDYRTINALRTGKRCLAKNPVILDFNLLQMLIEKTSGFETSHERLSEIECVADSHTTPFEHIVFSSIGNYTDQDV